MANEISLMIIPTSNDDSLPQILMERNGVWVDMSADISIRSSRRMSFYREEMDKLLDAVMKAFEKGGKFKAESIGFYSNFKSFYEILVPLDVRNVITQAAESSNEIDDIPTLKLHVNANTEWIPWEIFRDEKDFLGVRFQIARLPISNKAPDTSDNLVHQVRKIYNFLGNNVLLPARPDLLTLWEGTFTNFIPPINEIRQPNGTPDSYPIVDSIQNGRDADILHITCHGGVKNSEGEIGWSFNHTSPLDFDYHLRTKIIEGMKFDMKPLVFGNACSSVSTGGDNVNRGLASGFGSTFYSCGAFNFIGSFAPISQQLAIDFAKEFYSRLLGIPGEMGLPIGKALWSTKQHFRVINDGDPSYLFYCLYGLPETLYTK
jgi:CHAT domain